MNIGTVLGQHLRSLRGGRSREDVAAAAKIHPAHYANLENGGRADPRSSTVIALSRALDVPVEKVLEPLIELSADAAPGGEAPPPPAEGESAPPATSRRARRANTQGIHSAGKSRRPRGAR